MSARSTATPGTYTGTLRVLSVCGASQRVRLAEDVSLVDSGSPTTPLLTCHTPPRLVPYTRTLPLNPPLETLLLPRPLPLRVLRLTCPERSFLETPLLGGSPTTPNHQRNPWGDLVPTEGSTGKGRDESLADGSRPVFDPRADGGCDDSTPTRRRLRYTSVLLLRPRRPARVWCHARVRESNDTDNLKEGSDTLSPSSSSLSNNTETRVDLPSSPEDLQCDLTARKPFRSVGTTRTHRPRHRHYRGHHGVEGEVLRGPGPRGT